MIYAAVYDSNVPQELKKLGEQYINELPKAARNNQEVAYEEQCKAVLNDFRQQVNMYHLAQNQVAIDANAAARFDTSEKNADDRADRINENIDEAVEEVNAHTDESNAQQTGKINAHTSAVGNSVVNRVNEHTDETVENAKTDIISNIDNMGERISDEIKESEEAIKLNTQQHAVLDAKRQTLSDMLSNEVNEGISTFRDSTIIWLGSAADRVMASKELTFEEKQEAIDELIRMADEENVISDSDKGSFNATYLFEEREHI